MDTSFADDASCGNPVRALFDANIHLSYYPPGLTGPTDLQSDFIQSTDNPMYFICTSPPLNNSVTFGKGELTVTTVPDTFVTLHNAIEFVFDSVSNIIVYNNTGLTTLVPWTSGDTVSSCGSLCELVFQDDGNFVKYYNNAPLWASGTETIGETLECLNQSPWIQIYDATGEVVWDAVQGLINTAIAGSVSCERAVPALVLITSAGLLIFEAVNLI